MDISIALNRNTKSLGKLAAAIRAKGVLTVPSVLSVAPTITVGAPYAGSAITNPIFYSFVSGQFSVLNKASWTVYFTYNSQDYYTPPTSGGDGVAPGGISFIHDGQAFELQARAGDSWQFLVDGQLLQSGSINVASAGGISVVPIKVDFGSRARRHIIAFGQTFGFAGVRTGLNDTLEPYDLSSQPYISCVSDSYGQQSSSIFAGLGCFLPAALRLGIPNFALSPGGGSGYITGGTGNKTFQQREANVAVGTPDLFLCCGAINDGTTGLQTGAAALFSYFRGLFPNAVIVATGPWAPNPTYVGSGTAKRDAVKAALQSIAGPWVFVDNLAGTWLNSSGASGTIGNAPWQTGDGRQITFTGALSAATSATLSSNWAGTTGTYNIIFSDGSVKSVTLTNGSAAVSWTGAVTATATAGAYTTTQGNSTVYIGPDGLHPIAVGEDYLGSLLADGIAQGVLAL